MKTSKTDNGFFFIILVICLIVALFCSCTKREELPQQIIVWENSTNMDIEIFVFDVDEHRNMVGLRPNQTIVLGDATWLGHEWTVIGSQVYNKIEMRNTVTSAE